MASRWGNNGNSEGLYIFFLGGGSKITADGNYSCEMKIYLLLGIKTNLYSILKSRDTVLSTKAHLVQVMFFLFQ